VPNSKVYRDATEAARQSVTQRAETVLNRVQQETHVPGIQNLASQFADTIYPEILDELEAARQVPTPDPIASDIDPNPDPALPPSPIKQSVSIKKLALPGAGHVLETEADIDRYLAQLRTTLLETIHDNKRITL
jgi:hypothetical protein